MDLPDNFSSAILSGGLNSRMGGEIKSFLSFNGQTFLHRLQMLLKPLFSEILLVTKNPRLYSGQEMKIIKDQFKARSPLVGIHAALQAASSRHVFIIACDLPLLRSELVKTILEHFSPEHDVTVPLNNNLYEPLCAIYSQSCLQKIETLLTRNQMKITKLFDLVKVNTIQEKILRKADQDLVSFLNINTPQEFKNIKNQYYCS